MMLLFEIADLLTILKVFAIIIVMTWFWNFVTVLIHELGHALPALLFTKEDVLVMLGTYEPSEATFGFKTERLTLCFVPLFMPYSAGFCAHQPPKNAWQKAIILLGGSVFTFLSALLFIFIIYGNASSEFMQFNALIFLGLSAFQLFTNLYPSQPHTDPNGARGYSDGYQLLTLFRKEMGSEIYKKIQHEYETKDYEAAARLMTEWRINNRINRSMYELGKQVYTAAHQHEEIINLSREFAGNKSLKSEDLITIGNAYTNIENYRKALHFYQEALYLNPFDGFILHKIGLNYINLGEYRNALPHLERALEQTPADPKLQFHLGYTHYKNGRILDAISFFENACALNSSDALCPFKIASILFEQEDFRYAKYFMNKSEQAGGKDQILEFEELEEKLKGY